ncbi:syntaxin-binding protein 5 isoform 2 [Danaus plexippus plexippus]|uniref:Syntaxin-binding protein 5 isoform 2 n=1 Tax=Danaus plexippus plexippus TaxID=278856 RepID=A0A212FHR7_DANPL|nr:syntaxin-binding protein 5 isoform 2 [Danaus plexippus plexippus]
MRDPVCVLVYVCDKGGQNSALHHKVFTKLRDEQTRGLQPLCVYDVNCGVCGPWAVDEGLLGGPGVDAHVRHESGEAVLHAKFVINEGALVTATADDQLNLWTFRQKFPQRVQALKFQRERITCLHLPLQSKWIHVGTERGNVHVVNIETFALSGYVINWNKAIEVPGAVPALR